MIGRIALLLALAAATPVAAQHGAEPGAPVQPASPQVEHAAEPHVEEGHGEGIDFMHHILDSREIELPGTVLHLPAAGSWMVGPIDMTPTKHVVFLVLAAILVLLVLLPAAAMAGRAREGRTSGKRHNAVEAVVLYIRDQVVMPNIGHGGEKFAPFVISLFFFILFANLLGLVPWGSTATANISVTAALALMAFLVVEVGGMMALGPKGYLGTIFFVPKGMNPVAAWTMAVALAPVELMGKITKPIALAIRLMANMTAGHIVLLAIISLIFVFGSFAIAVAPVLMAVAITFLEIFVSLLQAYIFAMLTSVFIGLMQHAH
jgi:F-type H+-transporting ATPase subunit a